MLNAAIHNHVNYSMTTTTTTFETIEIETIRIENDDKYYREFRVLMFISWLARWLDGWLLAWLSDVIKLRLTQSVHTYIYVRTCMWYIYDMVCCRIVTLYLTLFVATMSRGYTISTTRQLTMIN